MAALRKAGLDKIIPKITKPFLGICLGLQLLGLSSEEDQTKCFGIFPGKCRRFPPTLKTPHLGWNKVFLGKKSPLTMSIPDGSYFYFAHSYYLDGLDGEVVGKTSYGVDVPSIIQKDNFFAVQFHPEKSGEPGLRLLNNFCELC